MSKPGVVVIMRFQLKGIDVELAGEFLESAISFISDDWDHIVDMETISIKTLAEIRREKSLEGG